MRLFFTLIGLIFIPSFIAGNTGSDSRKIKEKIIHYYSVKMVDGMPVKDKLKNCFSCNQGVVFDKNGREIELRFYKADMKSTFGIDRYVYGKSGRKTGSKYFDEKGNHTTTYKYSYDSLSRKKFSRAYDAKTGAMLYGSEFGYDNEGNQYETASLDKAGEAVNFYRREYNLYRLPALENIVDKTGKVTFKVRYEYFPCGKKDWVDQITYYNGKLTEIRNKEILYFDTDENEKDK